MSLQSALKELRSLKQDEMTLINLASKVSDQLNRLKVEELALKNLVRLQQEDLESQSGRSTGNSTRRFTGLNLKKGDNSAESDEEERVVPLDLVVNQHNKNSWVDQEEEEEEDDDNDVERMTTGDGGVHDDIEQFVQQLSNTT